MVPSIGGVELDRFGRVVLDDAVLAKIENHLEFRAAGGASNTSCTNATGCTNSTNGSCSNQDCAGSSNGNCGRQIDG